MALPPTELEVLNNSDANKLNKNNKDDLCSYYASKRKNGGASVIPIYFQASGTFRKKSHPITPV